MDIVGLTADRATFTGHSQPTRTKNGSLLCPVRSRTVFPFRCGNSPLVTDLSEKSTLYVLENWTYGTIFGCLDGTTSKDSMNRHFSSEGCVLHDTPSTWRNPTKGWYEFSFGRLCDPVSSFRPVFFFFGV